MELSHGWKMAIISICTVFVIMVVLVLVKRYVKKRDNKEIMKADTGLPEFKIYIINAINEQIDLEIKKDVHGIYKKALEDIRGQTLEILRTLDGTEFVVVVDKPIGNITIWSKSRSASMYFDTPPIPDGIDLSTITA